MLYHFTQFRMNYQTFEGNWLVREYDQFNSYKYLHKKEKNRQNSIKILCATGVNVLIMICVHCNFTHFIVL